MPFGTHNLWTNTKKVKEGIFERTHFHIPSKIILVYWSSFLVLWTILELSIEFYMYFHKLSRQTPPHQVADSQ